MYVCVCVCLHVLVTLDVDVFAGLPCVQMACQDAADDDDTDAEDEEQAEHDCALVESAGELMPAIVKLIGGHQFAPYFADLLPQLLKRLVRAVLQLMSAFVLFLFCFIFPLS